MIQKSMKEIQQLFFDLALLVDEQSEMLDYVQLNVISISLFDCRLIQPQIEQIEQKQNFVIQLKKWRKSGNWSVAFLRQSSFSLLLQEFLPFYLLKLWFELFSQHFNFSKSGFFLSKIRCTWHFLISLLCLLEIYLKRKRLYSTLILGLLSLP